MNNLYTVDQIAESLGANLNYFIENTLNLLPNKTDDEAVKIKHQVVSPQGLTFLYVFVMTACDKYGYTDIQDKKNIMTRILETVYNIPSESCFSVMETSLSFAFDSSRELSENKRTMLTLANEYAVQIGNKFVPGESHIDFVNIYALIILSSSFKP